MTDTTLKVTCPACKTPSAITHMYLDGNTLVLATQCGYCAEMYNEEQPMFGIPIRLTGDETIDLIEADIMILLPIEGREFVNTSSAEQRGISILNLIEEVYEIEEEPPRKIGFRTDDE